MAAHTERICANTDGYQTGSCRRRDYRKYRWRSQKPDHHEGAPNVPIVLSEIDMNIRFVLRAVIDLVASVQSDLKPD